MVSAVGTREDRDGGARGDQGGPPSHKGRGCVTRVAHRCPLRVPSPRSRACPPPRVACPSPKGSCPLPVLSATTQESGGVPARSAPKPPSCPHTNRDPPDCRAGDTGVSPGRGRSHQRGGRGQNGLLWRCRGAGGGARSSPFPGTLGTDPDCPSRLLRLRSFGSLGQLAGGRRDETPLGRTLSFIRRMTGKTKVRGGGGRWGGGGVHGGGRSPERGARGVTGRADLRASVSPPLPLCQSLGLGGNTECARGGGGRTQRGPARVCGAAAPLVPVPALSPSRCARGVRGGPGDPAGRGAVPPGPALGPPAAEEMRLFLAAGAVCALSSPPAPPPSAPPPLGPFSSGPTPPAQFPHSRRLLGGTCGRSGGAGGSQ